MTRQVFSPILIAAAVSLALSIPALPASAADDAKSAPAPSQGDGHPALLDPSLATDRAPDTYRVKLETTEGDVVILVNRSWAPNGADRFYNLVEIGYFEDVAFFRAIKAFMVQAGFHGDPKVNAVWSQARIDDDPILQPNKRGMVTFAQPSAPNARTTQFFINTVDNDYLEQHGSFAPFGKVISGMEVVDEIYTGYGEGAPRGRGPSQAAIARDGNAYLKSSFPELDYILRATIIDESK
jgi:peptidyl-prolyl cis-trans isomerase A (cyclophilin A)